MASITRERLNSVVSDIVTHVRRIMDCESGIIPLHVPVIGGTAGQYVNECITSGWVSSVGGFVDRFEKDLATFTGAEKAVAVVNGTAALHVALRLCGVQPGDEVLMPSLTFVATANAVTYCGATPHFIDVEESTLGVSAEAARRYLTDVSELRGGECLNVRTGRRIRCLIGMHAFGHPFDIAGMLKLCQDFHLDMVEDAAESIGSYYNGRHTGTFGRVGILSFNGNKTITTGGGGAIITNDMEMADLAKHLTTTAKVPHPYRYFHDSIAYNYRLPNLNAALGCSQLEDLPNLLESKRRIASDYISAFADADDFRVLTEPLDCKSNYWLTAIILSSELSSGLDEIIRKLHDADILVRPIWEPLHTLPMFASCPRMNLSETERLASRIINLPSTPM